VTRYWTCTKCSTRSPRIKQLCISCGNRRPARRRPKHHAALDLPYEHYVELNGGEHCGICGTFQKPGGKRLHRDHDHRSGKPRGILCFRDNAALRPYMTLEWLKAAVAYLERTEDEA
jgi:hypothetical protein